MSGRNRQCITPQGTTSRSPCEELITLSRNPARLPGDLTGPAIDLLEQLDDVIFDAIRGCTTSLAKAEQLWPKTVARLGWEAVEESREQYLRYALDVTHHGQDLSDPTGHGRRSPEHCLAALDVIELLLRSEF